ncbi:hypothetical protein PVA39_11420 [Pseudomonas sp. CNPSo 3701]|nr:hypothetical protein [Pseudomonas sp. CNPSo 3701]
MYDSLLARLTVHIVRLYDAAVNLSVGCIAAWQRSAGSRIVSAS